MIRLLSKLFNFVLFIIICTPTVSFAVTSSGRNVDAHLHKSFTNPTNTVANDLVPPSFDFQNRPTYKPCGNEIVFSYDNINEGAGTEIWRSRSADSDFVLVGVKYGENVFIDQALSSNKTFYYKLRAVKDNNTSEFSDVAGFESGAKWFDPTLELIWLGDNTVQGTLTDQSYLEYSYQISFFMEGGAPNELHENVMLSDSGETFMFTHRRLQPGVTYIYTVDAQLDWSCGSRLYSNVARDTITVPGDLQSELLPPVFAFDIPLNETCGNEIVFALRNKNEGSFTEIWRSRNADSGFEKIRVFDDGTIEYTDDSLDSRKDYYYKGRAVTSTDTSEFSETQKFTSGAKWFPPTLELTVLPDNTVKGTFTDRSYLDDSYDFSRSGDGNNNLFHEGTVLPDSGHVITFIDTATLAGGTYTYHVDLYYCRANMLPDVLVKTITVPKEGWDGELVAPEFAGTPPWHEPCGNELVFVIDNDNRGADTEVWRSRDPDSGFELIDVGPLDGTYVDDSLSSNKDYYYKLRAVNAKDTSEFSRTAMFSSGAKWFQPTLELTVLPDNTVKGTFTDRSYLDDFYDFIRSGDGDNNLFHEGAQMLDSGRVFTFIDTATQAGGTYSYHVDLYYCRANMLTDVLVKTITIPNEGEEHQLMIPEFVDVWPGFDLCGNQIGFVIANLNDERRTEIWRSRQPDSGFEWLATLDGNGSYLDDGLASRKDYYYKLRAVTATDTSEFSEARRFTSGAEWFAPTLELSVLPDNTVQGTLLDRSYLDDSYEIYRTMDFYSSAVLTDSGRVHTFIDTFVTPGETYTYHVDLYYCGANRDKDIIVKSISVPSDEAGNASARVNVYPNPVAHRATVQITGEPSGQAHITLVDAKGQTHFSATKTVPSSGQFNSEIDLQDLQSGLYYMNVEFEGNVFSETILITD